MSEMKDKIKQALPKGVIMDEAVLEKIVGGIQTGMTRKDLDLLLADAGIKEPLPAMDKIISLVAVSKPGPGGL